MGNTIGHRRAHMKEGPEGQLERLERPDGIVKISDSVYLLSEPVGQPEVELVFVHGLQLAHYGDAYWKTWTAAGRDKDGKEVCWPMTWLKEDFPTARIWSLSYDSSLVPPKGRLDLYSLGQVLAQELVDFAKVGDHPIVFVCHDLGSQVVNEMVIQAQTTFGKQPKYADFLLNIRGFFYVTPHSGSMLTELASHLPSSSRLAERLRIMDIELGRLNYEFERIEKEHYANKWQFFVLAETQKTTFGGFNAGVSDWEYLQRYDYPNRLEISGVWKPDCRMSSSYLALRNFISNIIMTEQALSEIPITSAAEKRESDLMEKYEVSRRELYDDREITIFRVGDREYSYETVFSDNLSKTIFNNLFKTRSFILDILHRMNELVKEVNLWHNQCRHLHEKYSDGVDKIVQALNVLIAMNEGPIIGLNLPLLQFMCSKLKCAMLEGEALLLLCSRRDYYTKAALELSSPRLSKPTVSRFTLLLRELDWTVDFICSVQQLYQDRDKSFDDWEWCEERRKLVYRGNLSVIKEESLEDDNRRQTLDQEVLLESLGSKPNNIPSSSVSSSLSSRERDFTSWLWTGWWTWMWMRNFGIGVNNQHQLEALLKKRLEASSNILDGRSYGGNKGCSNHTVSKTDPVLTYFWIENPQFIEIRCLGKGAYKTFKSCKWLGETVAVAQSSVIEEFETEVGLLARVQHPNVVELISYACDDSKGTLVTELMEQDLGALIIQQQKLKSEVFGPPFDLPVAVDIILQIVEAMIHSHKCGIIHRDLKPQNFLASPKIFQDHSFGGHDIQVFYCIKLIDFGEAKMGGPDCSFQTYMRGTSVYRAPEVYKHEESNEEKYYKLSADVYSFSMTCYEVLTGKQPFSETEWKPSEVKRFVLNGNRPLYPFRIPSLLKDLIERCWAQNPEDRPSFEEIRKDLWQCKLYYAWSEKPASSAVAALAENLELTRS